MILVTGGAGYIGSHTCVELLEAGHEIVVLDNFSNSKPETLDRIREITHKDFPFYEVDLLDAEGVKRVFDEQPDIEAVIHFAGLKAVGESCEQPLRYYHNNLTGTLHLCEQMQAHGVKSIIFSSSATVYGDPASVPIREDFPLHTTNPYGSTKLMIENILQDLVKADPEWNVVLLRYFNPVGAHESGLLGEDPNGIPNNLTPYIAKVATGELPFVRVFGNDYPTPDGTGVRDYIHVVDLAQGHIKALAKNQPGVYVYNLGTGVGYSVLDVIHAYEKACGHELPYQIMGRRPGDIAQCYADPTKAEKELGWKAERNLEDMCRDSWHFMTKNR
ncbi:MAG TPA: UDP-glucose 4-epimerase GalE [Candidatus Faecimorpha stercoravium]|nr:UDP-glucose 4-epimerase GalE [Candidatus Faecimorpha stercoravium]